MALLAKYRYVYTYKELDSGLTLISDYFLKHIFSREPFIHFSTIFDFILIPSIPLYFLYCYCYLNCLPENTFALVLKCHCSFMLNTF